MGGLLLPPQRLYACQAHLVSHPFTGIHPALQVWFELDWLGHARPLAQWFVRRC